MRYQRNKGGAYGMGLGLLGLLVTTGILVYVFWLSADTSMRSYNTSKDALDKAVQLSEQVAEQANQRTRDLSNANARNGATNNETASNGTDGDTETNSTTPARTPPRRKITDNVPLQMPDHGAGAMMEEMN